MHVSKGDGLILKALGKAGQEGNPSPHLVGAAQQEPTYTRTEWDRQHRVPAVAVMGLTFCPHCSKYCFYFKNEKTEGQRSQMNPPRLHSS